MLHYQYTYAGLSVYLCCTFGASVLHSYWHYYSKVFTVAFLSATSDVLEVKAAEAWVPGMV